MFDSVDTANDCIRIATGVLSTIKINPQKMLAGLSPDMLATDLAEYLVRKGMALLQTFSLDVSPKLVRHCCDAMYSIVLGGETGARPQMRRLEQHCSCDTARSGPGSGMLQGAQGLREAAQEALSQCMLLQIRTPTLASCCSLRIPAAAAGEPSVCAAQGCRSGRRTTSAAQP